MTDVNEEKFLEVLVKAFPQIREDVLDEDYEGLLPLQVGFFTRFTQRAIDAKDLEVVSICFGFVDSILKNTESIVENALYISFLGKLVIKSGSEVEGLLPNYLKTAYWDLKNYHDSAVKNEKLNDFFKKL